jgi:hypothetical protein
MKVYLIGDNEGRYKIGCTKHPVERLKQLQTANPSDLKIICTVSVKNDFMVERTLHRQFAEKNINGEWFVLDSDDIDNFTESASKIDSSISLLKEAGNHFI